MNPYRFVAIPLALLAVLSGCGRKASVDEASVGDVRGGRSESGFADKETQKQFARMAKASNMEAEFDGTGGITLTDKETGAVVTQNASGDAMTIQGANGAMSTVGGDWPKNEFTQQIPTPPFKHEFTTQEGNRFVANFAGVSVAQAKAYREKLKAAGFDQEPQTVDQTMEEVTILSYKAAHTNGSQIEFVFTGDSLVLSVSR